MTTTNSPTSAHKRNCSVSFFPKEIRQESTPHVCYVCGYSVEKPHVLAGLVDDEQEGESIVALLEDWAQLLREPEDSEWPEVVIAACPGHFQHLRRLKILVNDGSIHFSRIAASKQVTLISQPDFERALSVQAFLLWKERKKPRSEEDREEAGRLFREREARAPTHEEREKLAMEIGAQKQPCRSLADWRDAETDVLSHQNVIVPSYEAH